MGGGSSIEIHHSQNGFMHINDKHFQELLSSKTAREQLFQDIAKFHVDGKADRSTMVTLPKLAAYFTNNTNSLYPGFQVNVDTVNAAFKYTVEKFTEKQSLKKKKTINSKAKTKNIQEPKLTPAMVHSFLPTLLLFMRVWDIFDAADKLVVEDKKIFKGEFLRIKEKLNNVHGINIFGDTPKEDWDKEFDILDKNNDNYICFEEMCTYAIEHIKKPFDYNPEDDEALLNETYEEVEVDSVRNDNNNNNNNNNNNSSSHHFIEVISKLPGDEVTAGTTVADIPVDTNNSDAVVVTPSTQLQTVLESLEVKGISTADSTPTGITSTADVSCKQEQEQTVINKENGKIMFV